MEKDYFKDRPPECTERSFFSVGDEAFICLKAAQKTATCLSDLTRIKIEGILTPQSNHPRGIKLKGVSFQRDEYGNILVDNDYLPIKFEAIGRCTYPFKNGKVLTKDRKTNIVNSDSLVLVPVEQIGDKYNISITFASKFVRFDCIVNPYCYYSEQEIPSILEDFSFEDLFTDGCYCFVEYKNATIAAPLCNVVFESPYVRDMNAVFEAGEPYLSRFIKVSAVSCCGVLT